MQVWVGLDKCTVGLPLWVVDVDAISQCSAQCPTFSTDPLRPLWPALGLMGVLFLTALIVLANNFYERWRGERRNPQVPVEPDSLPLNTLGQNYSQ